MMKRNVINLRQSKPAQLMFECPECKEVVTGDDFITSIRLIEDSWPLTYRVKNICRQCRDSGI